MKGERERGRWGVGRGSRLVLCTFSEQWASVVGRQGPGHKSLKQGLTAVLASQGTRAHEREHRL